MKSLVHGKSLLFPFAADGQEADLAEKSVWTVAHDLVAVTIEHRGFEATLQVGPGLGVLRVFSGLRADPVGLECDAGC